MTESFFPILDAVGTVAFAMSGAFKAVRRRLDLLGVPAPGFVTAMGGGVTRDVLLQRTPAAFASNGPPLCSLPGCVLASAWQVMAKPLKAPADLQGERAFLLVDGLGLAVFAVTGARPGHEAGLTMWSTVLLAAITGVGGGALRDLFVLEVPLVLKAVFYATAAPIGGLAYALLAARGYPAAPTSAAAFSVTFVLRAMAIYRGWSLPRLPS